jgi:lycopene cyclase CruA
LAKPLRSLRYKFSQTFCYNSFMQFSISDVRKNFPATVQSLSHLPNFEAWLARIYEIEQRWNHTRENPNKFDEVIFYDAKPKNANIEAEFDIIYAGGTLGLLHAATMSKSFNRKCLVFDAHTVGKTHRDWNISDSELLEFVHAGLFTLEEIETAVANRYDTGFVKFFDGNSSVKTPKLFMDNVLDVAIEADVLLEIARRKLIETGSAVIDDLRFVRAFVQKNRVIIECENGRFFSAKMFVDATGTNSAVSRQINNGHSITHVCPTVGTVSKGFQHGKSDTEVDFSIGEILVSNEDISDDRQLIWEGFAGNQLKDEYTTYLFFYDSVESKADKSLFKLFEDYFEKLPSYKAKGENFEIVKPVFGYIPSVHHLGWKNQKRTATDRILLVGDAAGLSSPLTFCGFGSHVRNLRKLTNGTEKALLHNSFDEKTLNQINAYEANVAQMSSLAEFMRPTPNSESFVVNETMNAVMMALSQLDNGIAQELFQDRVTFSSFKKVLAKTARLHPKVYRLMFDHLGVKGAFWWIANIAEAALKIKN